MYGYKDRPLCAYLRVVSSRERWFSVRKITHGAPPTFRLKQAATRSTQRGQRTRLFVYVYGNVIYATAAAHRWLMLWLLPACFANTLGLTAQARMLSGWSIFDGKCAVRILLAQLPFIAAGVAATRGNYD